MLSPLPRRSGWTYYLLTPPQPYQPSPKGSSGRPAHRPFRGLLGVHSRYGLHTRAVTVYRDTLTGGFSHFVTSMTAPVASGWSGCRVGFAPTGKRRLVTAHTHSRPLAVKTSPSVRKSRGRRIDLAFPKGRQSTRSPNGQFMNLSRIDLKSLGHIAQCDLAHRAKSKSTLSSTM